MAPRLSPSAFKERIAAGGPQGSYLLVGPDHALKDELTSLLAGSLDEGLRAFNLDRLHVADSRPEARGQVWMLADLARTHPVMAPWRLIIVHGVEKLVTALRKPEGARGEWDELGALEEMLGSRDDRAVVVFVAGGDLDRRVKAAQVLEHHATVVDCDPLADAGDAIAWIRAEAASEQIRIEPAAVRLLATLAGNDAARLRKEFERAALFASGEGIITEAAVREVTSGPGLLDPWAMINAIERGNPAAALRELALKLDHGEESLMILGQLGWYVRTRLHPGLVSRAVESLFRTDLALKTSRGDARVLLERLIVELSG
ncbi:MAG: DNA polymerase III subunit delta [Acidobacteriota bacterium]